MEIPNIDVPQIAMVCHEANRAYCVSIGDNPQPAWADAPEWQRKSALDEVVFHLDELNAGGPPRPEASHESWLAQKRQGGWTYGPTKDADRKEHPCCVSYAELPLEQKRKDYIFCAIVTAFWKSHAIEEQAMAR